MVLYRDNKIRWHKVQCALTLKIVNLVLLRDYVVDPAR